jgi:hypothetical protein
VQVHDRDDVDALGLDAIQKAVGKLRNEKTPDPATKSRAGRWKLRQSFVGELNRYDEAQAETCCLVFVELSGGDELVPGVRMKLKLLTEAWSGPS